MSSRERMIVRLSKPHLPIQFRYLNEVMSIDPAIGQETGDSASRAVVAQALNLLLLADLLERTPTAAAYVEDLYNEDHKLVFDHGALRTVDLAGMGTLPPGRHAIARVLEPLGYTQTAIYPLDRLGMTGFSYTHSDFPEALPQFFVSELHASRFSPAFQRALLRVTEQSEDPLDPIALEQLDRLASAGELPLLDALALLPALVACFDRQHCGVRLEDYETLLAESAEGAWIATEGNSFNHATNRVANLKKVVAEQRLRGRPIKPTSKFRDRAACIRPHMSPIRCNGASSVGMLSRRRAPSRDPFSNSSSGAPSATKPVVSNGSILLSTAAMPKPSSR